MPLASDEIGPDKEPDESEVIANYPVGLQLAASVSYVLRGAGIACLLWGHLLLTAFGVPSIVDVSISLIVGLKACLS